MILGTLLLAVVGAGLGWVWWPLAFLVLPVWLWLMAFFRDPDRTIPTEHSIMVCPADGLVTDIKDIENDPYLNGPAVRVGIFLNVFNVHGNRAPCDGKITNLIYKKGKFINALKHEECSAENEANTIVMADPITGVPTCVVRQIAGLIAKRIICEPKIGDVVHRGDRIGFIKFGSRTELTISRSLAPVITVKVGDKVVGGSQIIARLGAPGNAIA